MNMMATVLNNMARKVEPLLEGSDMETRVGYVMAAIAKARYKVGPMMTRNKMDEFQDFMTRNDANRCVVVLSMFSLALDKYIGMNNADPDTVAKRWSDMRDEAIALGDHGPMDNAPLEVMLTMYQGHVRHDPRTGVIVDRSRAMVGMVLLKDCADKIKDHMEDGSIDPDKAFGEPGLELSSALGCVICAHINAYVNWCEENQESPFLFDEELLVASLPPVFAGPVLH